MNLKDLADGLNALCPANIYIGPPPWAKALPETPSGDYLTVRQAAARYNLGLRTVYRMVEQGLPVTRVGKTIRIRPSDLEQWLADRDTIFD